MGLDDESMIKLMKGICDSHNQTNIKIYLDFLTFLNTGIEALKGATNKIMEIINTNNFEKKDKIEKKRILGEILVFIKSGENIKKIPTYIDILKDCKQPTVSHCSGPKELNTLINCICNTSNDLKNLYKTLFEDILKNKKSTNPATKILKKPEYDLLDRTLVNNIMEVMDMTRSNEIYPDIINRIDICLKKEDETPVVEAEEIIIPEIIPVAEVVEDKPTKVLSNDAVTYITPQGLVYIHDKKTNEITEYEGSFENNKPRKVELKGDSIMVNGTQLTSDTFKDLYPITNKSKHKDTFYNNLVASTKRVIEEIQSAK